VLAAGKGGSSEADIALEKLCHTYWHPLYIFVRRRGYEPHDAQDLTQEFFARLLQKNYLHAVDRTKGKFRSFLLAALEHFLANEWRNAHAQKRGGQVNFFSLDDDSAEQQFLQVASAGLSPEQHYQREWATTLLERALGRLRADFVESGKLLQFDELKIYLTGEKGGTSYAALAPKLGMTEAGLKMAVHRMRQRYGELLREEIANTVSSPAEVEQELGALFNALS
jgi:RNA polymerase sigma-70 factor (ECF subfamily)